MSFTSEVKRELLNSPVKSECCKYSMLAGILAFIGNIKSFHEDMRYTLVTENILVAEKVAALCGELFLLYPEIKKQNNGYCLNFPEASMMLHELDLFKWGDVGFSLPSNLREECCVRSFIKGAFLSGGSVTSPEKRYHLEFVTPHYQLHMQFQGLFLRFDIPAKWVVRKSKYVTYFKDNEVICDVLAVMGAADAVMEISNTSIVKNVKNNTNRIMNCENANMDKAINAALRQAHAIQKLEQEFGIESLPENLRELAALRLENKELSLAEIGQMLDPPLSKSGVNHRMRKLMELAEKG